jgi:hypothetical protein
MKIFVSWSGIRGRHVAEALRDWLPYVIHNVEPWVSSHDIGAGERWSPAVARQLEATTFGIVCVTKESRVSPWILFEAGALAKSLEEGRLCPYLIDLSPAELEGPLAQFQAVPATKEATFKLIQSIRAAMPEPQLTDARLQVVFERFWPDLEAKLHGLPTTEVQRPLRPDRFLLEEILEHVRNLARKTVPLSPIEDEVSETEYRVRIDLSGFDVSPSVVEFDVDGASRFQDFLDRLFTTYLHQAFEPYTYGTTWIMLDKSGRRLEKQDKFDKRTLAEVGISKSNAALTVIRAGSST